MSKHLQRQIETLKKKILTVGALVEEAIAKSVSSLIHRDTRLAEEVIGADDTIDRSEVDVEEEVLKTLALHQPVAADLRFVIAVLKINSDLERMGDIARNISKKARFITKCEGFTPPVDFRDMAAKAQSMVRQCLDALVNADTKLARLVRSTDDDVDRMRKDIALFERILPPDPRGGTIGVRAARLSGEGGKLDFHVLLTREAAAKPFDGVMELVVAGRRANGRNESVTLDPVAVSIGSYGHLQGSLPLPEGFAARQVTIRVLDQPGGRQLGMRVINVG